MYINKDNSHSWVRISHDLNLLVTNWNNNTRNLRNGVRRLCVKIELQIILPTNQRQKQNHKDVLLPTHTQKLHPLGERKWSYIEPQEHSLYDHSGSTINKKRINLLRSRRKWSAWIQEIRIILCLSSLVWRKVEEYHGKRKSKQEKTPIFALTHEEQCCTSEL